jgi:hypothetical protein
MGFSFTFFTFLTMLTLLPMLLGLNDDSRPNWASSFTNARWTDAKCVRWSSSQRTGVSQGLALGSAMEDDSDTV